MKILERMAKVKVDYDKGHDKMTLLQYVGKTMVIRKEEREENRYYSS